MTSYIYISGPNSDPAAGDNLNDPLFGPVPSLGACMPNLRRQLEKGDWIFVISGRKPALAQYIIGGIRVEDRIDALIAYKRYPENRLRVDANGVVQGNIPVDARGRKHPLDHHSATRFEERVKNYLVGDKVVRLQSPAEVAIGRERTLPFLAGMKGKPGNRVVDIIGRSSQLSMPEVEQTLEWFDTVKRAANGQRRK